MTQSIEDINARLKEILKQVDDPDLPIEEILDLYEEAVRLGSTVGEVVESNISDADALEAVSAEDAEGAESAADAEDAPSPSAPEGAESAEAANAASPSASLSQGVQEQ